MPELITAGQLKLNLEKELAQVISRKIKEFEEQTGLAVSGVEIPRIDTSVFGNGMLPEYAMGQVRINVQ